MNQNDDPKQCKVYQFWEFLFDLLKNSRVVTSVKLMYSQLQMSIEVIYIFICHS